MNTSSITLTTRFGIPVLNEKPLYWRENYRTINKTSESCAANAGPAPTQHAEVSSMRALRILVYPQSLSIFQTLSVIREVRP
jgi:hypothetical protein